MRIATARPTLFAALGLGDLRRHAEALRCEHFRRRGLLKRSTQGSGSVPRWRDGALLTAQAPSLLGRRVALQDAAAVADLAQKLRSNGCVDLRVDTVALLVLYSLEGAESA